jgi:hypothetical protein
MMTPEQKLKHLILTRAIADGVFTAEDDLVAENIDDLYSDLCDNGDQWDYQNDVRDGEVETGLPCDYSRHYEAKAVAAKMLDGSWIGWTYWYGGGKHAEPEAIDWMNEAYALTLTEEEKVVTVQTFAKAA